MIRDKKMDDILRRSPFEDVRESAFEFIEGNEAHLEPFLENEEVPNPEQILDLLEAHLRFIINDLRQDGNPKPMRDFEDTFKV